MSNLYRKRALEKLSSPEQLDRMIVITPMSAWIAIVSGFLLLAAVLTWGFCGNIPVTLNYRGVYWDMGSVHTTYSSVEGRIKEIRLSSGENVAKDDVLLVIEDEGGELHELKSEVNGAVYNVVCEEGSYVSVGTELIKIREANPLEKGFVYCYVPLSEARQIEEGMQVMIYPQYLNSGEYGHIMGKVTEVSRFILSRSDLEKQIGNEEEIDKIMSGESVISIRCDLEEDSDSASGYKWSNQKGNDLKLLHGTMVDAEVVIANAAPIDMLF